MNFEEFKRQIPEYLEKELEPQKFQEFEEYLSNHPEAQKELKAFQQSWDMLDEVETIEPSPNYISRFWTTVSEEKTWQEKLKKGFKEALVGRRLAPVMGTVFILMIVSIFAIKNYIDIQRTDQMVAYLNENDLEMIEHVEMAENFDILEDMEFYEDLEIIENIDALQS